MPPHDPSTPEGRARTRIDQMLEQAGWVVQDREALNLAAGAGVAVREFYTGAGPADYALFVDRVFAGVIEAKRDGTILSAAEAQTRQYALKAPGIAPTPIVPLPFLYESTSVETYFTNGLDPVRRARRVFSFHRPETLKGWLDEELKRIRGVPGARAAATFQGLMQVASDVNTKDMRPSQITSVANLEKSIREGRRRALIQMATGSGKTYAAIASSYRFLKEGNCRRILFLVDRGNLGRQALKEFQGYTTPDDGRKFTELYNVVNLRHNQIDPTNKVVITTIQRLYSILKGEENLDADVEEGSAFLGMGGALRTDPAEVAYNPAVPPDLFELIFIDEAHRSIYSVWRQVLEYFDATLVGLTATPAKHTYAFFEKNVVSEYRHEHAVRDRVNVPYQVFGLKTRVSEEGATVVAEPGTVVGKRDRVTRAQRWEALDEDLTYEGKDVDRSVVVPDQIRTMLRSIRARMFTELFPGRREIPKTLIFAKSDHHAEDVLRILRDEWDLDNEGAAKITYKPEVAEGGRRAASSKPDDLIQAFRNSYNPRVAVTVDMIATGTDVKPLELLVFMRTVRSRGLFEQMKGRGVRVIDDADFQGVTPDAKRKTHFVIVDCVGVFETVKSDPPLDQKPSVSFGRLLEAIRAGNRDPEYITSLATRLTRMEASLEDHQKAELEAHAGPDGLRGIIKHLYDFSGTDKEETAARERFGLAEEETPTDEQRAEVRAELLEKAVAPIAYNPGLCQALTKVRREQEVTIDVVTTDEETSFEREGGHELDYDSAKVLVSEFETYVEEHRNEIDALKVLFERPYNRRLTRAELKALAEAIHRPPRQWTSEALWEAYEKVERGRVRRSSERVVFTDLISLARHAMGVEEELVSYRDQAERRFENWLAQQSNEGREFTSEQLEWLHMIKNAIVVDLEVRMDDLDQVPFSQKGGLGKAHSIFGKELPLIIDELHWELVA